MGFKEGIFTLFFIFLAISFIRPITASLGSAGILFKGPTGAVLAVGLFLYVIDAFLDRQGSSVPTALVQGVTAVTSARTPSVHKYISSQSTATPSKKITGGTSRQLPQAGAYLSFRKR